MVDIARELQAFRPINIERIPTDDKRFTPQVKIAFELYNKALGEIKDGYRDIAKSDLRKAVALCPEFSSAIMVLGILVFANGDRIGAVRVFNSVKDSKDREKAIAILDRLITEAERPVGNSRNYYSSASESVYKTPERSIAENDDKVGTPSQRPMPSYRRANSYSTEDNQNAKASPAESQHKAQNDGSFEINVTNKALLVIVAILIAFAVIASALLVSMSTSDNNKDGVLPTINPAATGSPSSGLESTPSSSGNVDYPLY